MEVQEAISQAEAHLKNATELAQRPVGKEELLYMWDNQITALDNFLADTEALPDPDFKKKREGLRAVKKQLQDTVIQFEAQQEGVELNGEEEMSDEERASMYLEIAGEMVALVSEALDEKVKDVKDLGKWEDPLAMVNGYLADSEPYQMLNRDLQKARSIVRVARKDLKAQIQDVFLRWRQADMAGGRDDED